MDGINVMLLSVAQQRIYVDAIFAMLPWTALNSLAQATTATTRP